MISPHTRWRHSYVRCILVAVASRTVFFVHLSCLTAARHLGTLWFFTYFASLADPYANNNESEDLEAGFKWERQTPAVVTAVDEYTDLVRVASMMCALRQFHSQDQVSILVFVVGPDSAFANELNAHASNQQFTIVKKFTSATAKQHLSRRDVPAVDAKPVVIAEAILTHELVLWLNPGTYVSKPLSAIFNFLSIHGKSAPLCHLFGS